LEEFFTQPRGSTLWAGIAAAVDFMIDVPRPELPQCASLVEKMNDQIAHIRYERVPGDHVSKLNAFEMDRAKGEIDRAVAKFEQNLSPEARPYWKPWVPFKLAQSDFQNRVETTTTATWTHSFTGYKKPGCP
jgi:hypothetical protein